MSAIALRHAWLQKHPSPLATGGEFHWYPAAADVADRELRARFVERLRGIEPPAVLWTLSPSRLAWAQVFSAVAPSDGRHYLGLVLTVAEPAADGARASMSPTTALFASLLDLPPAAPRTANDLGEIKPASAPVVDRAVVAARGGARAASHLGEIKSASAATGGERPGDAAAIARALLTGGTAAVAAPSSASLPACVAALERNLPAPRGTIEGAFVAGPSIGAPDRMAALAAAAWREPTSRAAAAWRLACELAGARESIDDIGAAVASLDERGARDALSATERAAAGEARSVVQVLHAWGRGRLDGAGSATTLPARLAELVALRALGQLASGADASAAIAEARWYALLPAARRAALLSAVGARASSLRPLTEVSHA